MQIYSNFSVAVSRSKDIPAFGPHIPENAFFPKGPDFADFLLAKGTILTLFSVTTCN